MKDIDLTKEFKKIEAKIDKYKSDNKDVNSLLKSKSRLLQVCYDKMSEAMETGNIKKIAENFAKELSILNNIKNIKTEIQEDCSDVEAEIAKLHVQMKENGLGWLIDNMPEKVDTKE